MGSGGGGYHTHYCHHPRSEFSFLPLQPQVIRDGLHDTPIAPLDKYSNVEAAAACKRCSVICVVNANEYGHILVQVETLLADVCGADTFYVATPEEFILLRRALNSGFSTIKGKSVTGR